MRVTGKVNYRTYINMFHVFKKVEGITSTETKGKLLDFLNTHIRFPDIKKCNNGN